MHIVRAWPDSDDGLAAELLVVQRSAYAVEAELIGDNRIPYLHESVHELRDAPVEWLIATTEAHAPMGAIAWQSSGSSMEIDRLVVSPTVHRRGVGRGLMRALLGATCEARVLVATGRENKPARALYESLGFDHMKDEEVLPQLWLARYRLER